MSISFKKPLIENKHSPNIYIARPLQLYNIGIAGVNIPTNLDVNLLW